MTVFQTKEELLTSIEEIVHVEDGAVVIDDEAGLEGSAMDELVYNAVFANHEVKATARWLIWEVGQELGVQPASIHDLYVARGRGETEGVWTVPAMNLRGMAYDMARAVFQPALPRSVGAIIF